MEHSEICENVNYVIQHLEKLVTDPIDQATILKVAASQITESANSELLRQMFYNALKGK